MHSQGGFTGDQDVIVRKQSAYNYDDCLSTLSEEDFFGGRHRTTVTDFTQTQHAASAQTTSENVCEEQKVSEVVPLDTSNPSVETSNDTSVPSGKKGKYKRPIDEHYEFSVDKLKKKIVRMSREHVIAQYKTTTSNKQYHWIKDSVRKSVQAFFLHTYEVDPSFYAKHESVFMFFILKDKKLKAKYGLKKVDDTFIELMSQTFGSKITIPNMRKFFKHPVVKALWAGEFGESRSVCFGHSEWLRESMRSLTAEQRVQIQEHFDKVGQDYLTLF